MKKPVFTGAGVAIITPMYGDGSINFLTSWDRIIEDRIARHTDAIIICGTTGECSTMTDEEQLARHQVHRGYGQSPRTGHCRCRFERYRPRLRTGSKVLPPAVPMPC